MSKTKRITATDVAERTVTLEANALFHTVAPTVELSEDNENGVYRFSGPYSDPRNASKQVRKQMRLWRALGAVKGQVVAKKLGQVKQSVSDLLLWDAIAVYCGASYDKIEDTAERAKAMLEEMNAEYEAFLHDIKRMAVATGDNVRNAKSSVGMTRSFLRLCNIFAEYRPSRLSEILDIDLRKVNKDGKPTSKRATFGGRTAMLKADFQDLASEVVGSEWADLTAERNEHLQKAQSAQNRLDVLEKEHFGRFEVAKASVDTENVNMTITKAEQTQLGILAS
tara:strand:- start:1042 stop:1884 length:843 start_codon:yes stop_codon:yes gene_type:complete